MNPISLLTSATSDRILDDPLVRRLCVSMMEEAARIGAVLGLHEDDSIENMIGRIRVGLFKMSMLHDLEHGKSVEIDALLTVTHDIIPLIGVPTPFIDSVLGLARLRAASLGLLARAASHASGDGWSVPTAVVQALLSQGRSYGSTASPELQKI